MTTRAQGAHPPVQMRHDPWCPTCTMNWWLNPPVKISGANQFRCVECKAVYSAEMLAAPDMLEALYTAKACLERLDQTEKSKTAYGDICAAIAKATASRTEDHQNTAQGE